MVPSLPVPGTQRASAGTAADAAAAAPGTAESGLPTGASPLGSSIGRDPAESSASDAGHVMVQRAQLPGLSASAVLPSGATVTVGSTSVVETGKEPTADSVSAAQAPDSGAGSPFPVAVTPPLVVPKPGVVAAPEAEPLPLAEAPALEIQLPEGGTSLPVAPTPGTTITHPDLPPTGALQPLAVPTPSEPTGTLDPVAAGTNGTAAVTGQPGAAISATGAPTQEHAPGSASADARQGPGAGGQTPEASVATALAGTEMAPAATNAPAQSLPPATGQIEVRTTSDDAIASVRVSNDGGISAVDPLETPATESPLVRTQGPAPLHRQLLGPMATLAAGPNGERTLSVNIAPEALGPITVKALLGGEGIRMELSAPTDAGREALRAMLPELRRELAASGSGTITLSTGADSSATTEGHTGNQDTGGSDARPFTGIPFPGLRTRDELAAETQGQETTLAPHDTSHLDVMA